MYTRVQDEKMFTVFAQVYANLGDLWENSRADLYKPETEGHSRRYLVGPILEETKVTTNYDFKILKGKINKNHLK